eukprot:gnl/TRDRNA2_/TRDRNA2_35060_c0_seq1.p1 gnl/TRDRNA2_/TRDRNA2_35060_c0~~gnl/TRDRNA2_/TRDRNA2_35060_c0_seq1.p1  ORF type:complete len:302 (+),score=35.93 gnl/TRDRNA2_/TRDRNA2_35060_c0_seq1:76-981(+)
MLLHCLIVLTQISVIQFADAGNEFACNEDIADQDSRDVDCSYLAHALASEDDDSVSMLQTQMTLRKHSVAATSVLSHKVQREPDTETTSTTTTTTTTTTSTTLTELELWYQKLDQRLRDHSAFLSSREGGLVGSGQYDTWAEAGIFHTVCQTGFDGGYSALRFLVQSKAHVYEFDLGEQDHAKVSAEFLKESFPERFTVLWGDSLKSIPEFRVKNPDVWCDLVIVDGGRDLAVAEADLWNFKQITSSNSLVAIDDTPCDASYCSGPTQAWNLLVSKGCISETLAVPLTGENGFRFGKFFPC